MKHPTRNQSRDPSETMPTARRPLLRAVAGLGAAGAIGLPTFTATVRASIPGVAIEFKRCHVAFVSNATAIDSLAVYYADRDSERHARYGIDPTETDPRGHEPLVIEYDADEDRTQLQLAQPRGSLVHIVAENTTGRTAVTNPTDACVPSGFNSPPVASFTATTDDSSATSGGTLDVTVNETVSLTSTATDPDLPVERLRYEWDLDSVSGFEANGSTVTTSYATPVVVTVNHRVLDDFGESDIASATITVRGADLAYPSRLVTKLLASDGNQGLRFGQAVSLDADTVLVGARTPATDDPLNRYTGVAYVFTRDATGAWSQQAKFTAGDSSPNNMFGEGVALDGDTALVGASGVKITDPDTGKEYFDAGAAYVFTRNATSGSWSQQQKLVAPTPVDGQRFGQEVSLDGDTALIGASRDDNFSGSAYVFTRDSTTGAWSQKQKLIGSDTDVGHEFGHSVDIDGDTVLIGAYNAESVLNPTGSASAGAAYVFTRDSTTGTWSQQTRLEPPGDPEPEFFGWSTSLVADTAVVGAPSDPEKGGAAYVFE